MTSCPKWIHLSEKITKEYESDGYVCQTCNIFRYPMFVHANPDESGYYTCYICGKDGSLRNTCIHCKIKRKNRK